MSYKRITTDVPLSDVPFVLAIIEADGGTAVQQMQPNGKMTIVATFPGNAPAQANPAAGSVPEKWMTIARNELGQAEVPGANNNARIQEYFASTTLGAQPDEVPWCSAFVNFCITKAGLTGTNSALARSWATWGVDSSTLVPGCIVVLSRGEPPHAHVGFFAGMDGGHIRLLGGNQGDAVSIVSFDSARIIGRRMPA
jgi:uncharacterized protein (TIGR02594 family)